MKVCVCCIERRGLNMLSLRNMKRGGVVGGRSEKKIDLKSFDMFEKV